MVSIDTAPVLLGTQHEALSLRNLLLIFRRRLKIFVLVAAIVFAVAAAMIYALPNTYSATANILIERRTVDVADNTNVLSDMPSDSAAVDTEVKRLLSRDMLKRVADRLRLYDNPAMLADMRRRGLLNRVFGAASDAPVTRDAVLDALGRNVDVARQGLTYVIAVTYNSGDPKLASTIANGFAIEYLDQQRATKRAASTGAEQYLQSRLSGLSSEVQARESAAAALRARAGLPGSDRMATYDEQVISDLSKQATELQSDLAEKRARYAAAQNARGNPSALPEVLASQVIRDLRAQRAAAASRVAELQGRYGERYPDVIAARQQLAALDAEIGRETNRIVSGFANDVEVAQQRLAVVNNALGAQRSRSVANSRATVSVNQFDREADVSRGLYETYLRRAKEAAASSDLAAPDATIVSVAGAPTKPSAPNRPLLLLAALLAALGLGLVVVILTELLDAKISSGDDIARHLGQRRLGSIPNHSASDSVALAVVNEPMSLFAESYRALVSNVFAGSTVPEGRGAVLMVTSALPHEGKTSVAGALGLSIARTGRRVLVVDTDLRRPRLKESLAAANPAAGLLDVLDRTHTLEQAITRDATDTIDVLPLRERGKGIEAMQDGRFAALLDQLRARYDTIILDTSPVLATSEARLIASHVDGVVLVVRWRRTSRYACRAAITALEAVGAPLLGVALNNVNFKAQSLYSDDDALAFYGSYANYYAKAA